MKKRLPKRIRLKIALAVVVSGFLQQSSGASFEGRITATLTRGGEVQAFGYTAGTNTLRIERTETKWAHAQNLIRRDTGEITLLFPHNRSYLRLNNAAAAGAPSPRPGMPARPTLPSPSPGMPGAMPPVPMAPMMEQVLELKPTGHRTNLLGYACEKFEIKQRGEIMEIWATDTLLPFEAWRPNQSPRFGPRVIEEQWADMLKSRKLFPLLAILRFEHGSERMRYQVQSITPARLKPADDVLFYPPAGYIEIQPLPF